MGIHTKKDKGTQCAFINICVFRALASCVFQWFKLFQLHYNADLDR